MASRAKEFSLHYTSARPAWVNGWPGWIACRDDTIYSVGALTIGYGRISRMDVVVDPARLANLRVLAPEGSPGVARLEFGE